MIVEKINVFIGKPNTGKSNILESLGLFSSPYAPDLKYIRFESMTDLFYDEDLKEEIRIKADETILSIKFENEQFVGKCTKNEREIFSFNLNYQGKGNFSFSSFLPFKFYRFIPLSNFPERRFDFLLPPHGRNLLGILKTSKILEKLILELLKEYGLRILLRPFENKIEIEKQTEGIPISYPYSLLSDTLQRTIFHLVAIETNENSIIIFEEPEAHSFPYYTKFLAECIALDNKNNQYFISTHNPFFLFSLLEKASKDDIGIFITYFEDHQTKVKSLNIKEIENFFEVGAGVFFNIEKFLEKE